MAEIQKNGFKVEVPLGLPTDGKVRNGYQVFLQEDTKQIEKHVEALTHLGKYINLFTLKVLHPFAGLGVTAQILDQAVPQNLEHVMWERDPVCVEYLTQKGYTAMLVKDSYESLKTVDLSEADAIIFDPTAGTIKTPGMVEFWDNASKCKVPLVWVTDSACSKIWLHKTHYPELAPHVENAEEYLRAYNSFLNKRGYKIVEAMREATVTYFVAVRMDTYEDCETFKEIVRL